MFAKKDAQLIPTDYSFTSQWVCVKDGRGKEQYVSFEDCSPSMQLGIAQMLIAAAESKMSKLYAAMQTIKCS